MNLPEQEKVTFVKPEGLGCGTCLITEELIREADRRKGFPNRISYVPQKVKHPALPVLDVDFRALNPT